MLLDPISKLAKSVPPVTEYVKLSEVSGSVVLKVPKLAPAEFSAALPPVIETLVGASFASVIVNVRSFDKEVSSISVIVTVIE